MDRNWFNINKTVSGLVARLSGGLGKVAIRRRNLGATALDIVEPTQSVTHFEQITAIGWFGWNGRLSGTLKPAQSEARLHPRHTRPPETKPRNGQ